MKEEETVKNEFMRTVFRWYFRLEIVVLCVALVAIGVGIASERTEYVSHGTTVSSQWDSPVKDRVNGFLSTPIPKELWDKAEALPFPVGNLIAIFRTSREYKEAK